MQASPNGAGAYSILFSALPSYPIGVPLVLKIRSKGPGGASLPTTSNENFLKPVPAPAPVDNIILNR
jgi:hypothetical protein